MVSNLSLTSLRYFVSTRPLSRSFVTSVRWREVVKIAPRMRITFTCTAPSCTKPVGHRSTHEFSKLSYEKGIVLIECPACQTRHLIADHLGWFDSDDLTQGGKFKTIEGILAAKGEQVKRGQYTAVAESLGTNEPLVELAEPVR